MKNGYKRAIRWVFAAVLVFGALSVIPNMGASGTSTTGEDLTSTPTSTPILTAAQVGNEYNQVRDAVNYVNGDFDRATAARAAYEAFLVSEQYHGRDTQGLEDALYNYDIFIQQAIDSIGQAVNALSVSYGFSYTGQVINATAVQTAINTTLQAYTQESVYLSRAFYQLHSALNLYHQVWGLDVPKIPKLQLYPLTLNPNYVGTPTKVPTMFTSLTPTPSTTAGSPTPSASPTPSITSTP